MERLDGEGRSKLRLLLGVAAAALPVETIYADHAVRPRESGVAPRQSGALETKLELLRKCLPKDKRDDRDTLFALARQTRLFDRDWAKVEDYAEKLK